MDGQMRIFKRVKPESLRNHPTSQQIYGDVIDDEMLASMRDHGQQTPIVVASDGKTIVSGHRRRQGAMKLEWNEVEVVIRDDLTDPLDIMLAVIHANKQREKTTEQKAREYKKLKEIEAEKAQKRLKTKGSLPVVNLPQPCGGGKSRDLAAEEVGMSGRTADKAAEVVDAIDEAEASGDTERAEDLRETLNKSTSAAHKKVDPKPEPTSTEEARTKLNGSAKTIEQVRVNIDAIVLLVGRHGTTGEILSDLDRALMAMKKWARAL